MKCCFCYTSNVKTPSRKKRKSEKDLSIENVFKIKKKAPRSVHNRTVLGTFMILTDIMSDGSMERVKS